MSNKKDFEKFYNENIDKIYRFIFFRVGKNKELAEDLTSEVFLKALNAFENYDEKISRSAWVFTIAKNHLANFWRDNKATERFPESGEETAVFGKKQDQNPIELSLILANLDERERDIVTFHYIYGYSYLEVAKMLKMSEGSIKVAAHRVIKKIQQKYDV